MSEDRKQPYAAESEMALIGAILCDPNIMPAVCEHVGPGDFYAHVHEDIFAAMLALYERGERAEKYALYGELQKRQRAEEVGGLPYLTRLMDAVETTQSAVYHARLIHEKAILRGLIHAGTKIVRLGYEGEVDVAAATAEADAALRAITERGVKASDEESVASVALRLYREMTGDKKRRAIHSPWASLNGMTGGFFDGEIVTWAARPKVGKSAAVAYLADYVAQHFGHVLYFALEMGKDETVRRFISMYSGIGTTRQRKADLVPTEWDRYSDAAHVLTARPISVYGRPKSVLDIRNAVRSANQNGDVRMVVIDHAGLLDFPRSPRASKHELLDEAYQQLSSLAIEQKLSLHLVQHVNRAGYEEPTLRDIRDGGNLEGISHVVIFPHRDNPLGTPEEQKIGKFIVAANRSGDEGIIPMRFEKSRHVWLEPGQRVPNFLKVA